MTDRVFFAILQKSLVALKKLKFYQQAEAPGFTLNFPSMKILFWTRQMHNIIFAGL